MVVNWTEHPPQNDALILIQSNYTASFLPSKNCFNSSRASIAGQHQGWHHEPRARRTALYSSGSLPKENRIIRRQTWMEKIFLDSKLFFLSERTEASWGLILAALTPVTAGHQKKKKKKEWHVFTSYFQKPRGKNPITSENAGNMWKLTGTYITILLSLGSREDDYCNNHHILLFIKY